MNKLLTTMMLAILLAGSALADGVLIPRPAPILPDRPLVDVKYHHVHVEINDPVAVTQIDQVFVNPHRVELEADYIFPIPENAAIDDFSMTVGDRKMEAELLDAEQARKIYRDIVRKRKDPALLEYADRGMYRVRVYPIPSHGEVRVQIEYKQTLQSDFGAVEYLYPLNTEKYSRSNLQDCKVEVNVRSFEDISAVYSPTHEIDVNRKSEKELTAKYYEENVKPRRDFVLYFTRQNKGIGFYLKSYREQGERYGHFIGILSPPLEKHSDKIDKNVIFILDRSGSMKGKKIKQAKDALEFCLLSLHDGDEFALLDYSDNVSAFSDRMIPADKDYIEESIGYVQDLEANGGTNIYEALEFGCEMIEPDGDPTYMIFLTDGLPTVGKTDINQIIKNTTEKNESRAKLFVFGVGYDVNAHLLDRLAQENGGLPDYVKPDEDIEVKISKLATRISRPALADIRIDFEDIDFVNLYPDPFPDLFYGSEIIVSGRFKNEGKSSVSITGAKGKEEVSFRFPVEFSDGSDDDSYIALLWANRRIGYLLQQLRLHGESEELVNEVIELSKKYGIVTEYTSFLVTGDDYIRASSSERAKSMARQRLKYDLDEMRSIQTGKGAVGQSMALEAQRGSNRAGYMDGTEFNQPGVSEAVERLLIQVGSKAFFKADDEIWVQGDIESDEFDIEIERYSEAYFTILDGAPELGKYLAVGDNVRLKIGDLIVQVSDRGKTELSRSELRKIFP
ncbi:MAG: VWA domain-containing protein [candidate division Zixibacteria bacterium]|nr:VWA domain-containing protein [candidate division Zixibacteria bacterium]